jgi:hypothetical protein
LNLLPAIVLAAGLAGADVQLPGLAIHGGEKKFVEATGQVATTNGILEFVAVEKQGRDYESLFTLDCRPSALKFALLLIGCETNSPISIEMEWRDKRVPVEQLLIDRHTKKPPTKLSWVFTGSYFTKSVLDGKEVFMADEEQAFIALWWQPSTLINLKQDFGNPYRGEQQGFEPNAMAMPIDGTPVKLIFRTKSRQTP